MGKKHPYRPDYGVSPGETISECLSALALDVDGAAFRMGCASGELKGIIAEGAPGDLASTSTDARVRDFLNEDETSAARAKRPAARRPVGLSP